jgi:thiol:disulfide interchange protein DsbD
VRGIKTFKADWTDYNPQISKALAKWNRGGIPVYVFYSGLEGSEPTLLPEVLTEGIVLDAIKIVPIRGN